MHPQVRRLAAQRLERRSKAPAPSSLPAIAREELIPTMKRQKRRSSWNKSNRTSSWRNKFSWFLK